MDPLENELVSIEDHRTQLVIVYHRNYNERFANLFDSDNSKRKAEIFQNFFF